MKVLLTGAFGNVGTYTLQELLNRDYEVICFDIKTKRNGKVWKKLTKKGSFKTIWGDITDERSVLEAMDSVDCILHLAAIIPPTSEKIPDLAMKVNVNGTKNIVKAAFTQEKKPKVILVISVSVHGPRMHLEPPIRGDNPFNPTNVYTNSKIKAEKIVRESGLPWTIVRLGAVLPVGGDLSAINEAWEIPLKQRIECIHSRDVGVALANGVKVDINEEILLLGGGSSCQYTSGEFFKKLFGTVGIKMFPESAFVDPGPPEENPDDWYFIDWMDTKEAQALLNFQNSSFEDYLKELKEYLGVLRYLAKLFSPIVYRMLLKKSPYYKKK